MPYFITIYIYPMKANIPHAFLGLTRKHPDELDKLKFEKNIEHWDYQEGKMKLWRKEEIKWYEKFENVEFNDGFYGFAPVKSTSNHWGKVFENNHFNPEWNESIKNYDYTLRSKNAFREYNRCTLEVSQEQYEFLLNEIKKEVTQTRSRNPHLEKDDSKMASLETLKENLYYNSYPLNKYPFHNCTTWVLHKLDSIGIETFNIKEWIPDAPIFDDLKELFPYLKFCNNVFLKFQSIDSNLESIKGAKAFRSWARSMIDNNYICYIDENSIENKTQAFCKRNENHITYTINKQTNLYEKIKGFYTLQAQLKRVYYRLDEILQSRLDKLDKLGYGINKATIKGDFELIYFDNQENTIKSFKAENNYNPLTIENFDLNIPANNCSISKFYPFIFIPKDTMQSRVLYCKYDYGKVSEGYQNDANKFYFNILAGIQSDKYWSKSYHKLSKVNQPFQPQVKEMENA